jgi:hypothetical protein
MKNLNGKNREGRKFDGLKIITYVITATCIFGSGGKQVPVASRRVGVAYERVPVACQYRTNGFQCVPNSRYEPFWTGFCPFFACEASAALFRPSASGNGVYVFAGLDDASFDEVQRLVRPDSRSRGILVQQVSPVAGVREQTSCSPWKGK